MQNYKTKFNNEISKRLNNKNWDNELSGNIFKAIKKKRNKMIAVTTTCLTSVAIISFAIINIQILNNNVNYEQFITEQVNNTFKTVYQNKNIDSFSNEMDSFILSSLDDRL